MPFSFTDNILDALFDVFESADLPCKVNRAAN